MGKFLTLILCFFCPILPSCQGIGSNLGSKIDGSLESKGDPVDSISEQQIPNSGRLGFNWSHWGILKGLSGEHKFAMALDQWTGDFEYHYEKFSVLGFFNWSPVVGRYSQSSSEQSEGPAFHLRGGTSQHVGLMLRQQFHLENWIKTASWEIGLEEAPGFSPHWGFSLGRHQGWRVDYVGSRIFSETKIKTMLPEENSETITLEGKRNVVSLSQKLRVEHTTGTSNAWIQFQNIQSNPGMNRDEVYQLADSSRFWSGALGWAHGRFCFEGDVNILKGTFYGRHYFAESGGLKRFLTEEGQANWGSISTNWVSSPTDSNWQLGYALTRLAFNMHPMPIGADYETITLNYSQLGLSLLPSLLAGVRAEGENISIQGQGSLSSLTLARRFSFSHSYKDGREIVSYPGYFEFSLDGVYGSVKGVLQRSPMQGVLRKWSETDRRAYYANGELFGIVPHIKFQLCFPWGVGKIQGEMSQLLPIFSNWQFIPSEEKSSEGATKNNFKLEVLQSGFFAGIQWSRDF